MDADRDAFMATLITTAKLDTPTRPAAPDHPGGQGWTNSHLYGLRAGDVGWTTPLPDIHGGGDFLDARKARLDDVLEDIGTKTLRYIYDFGDGWEHTITIERVPIPNRGCSTRA